MTPAFSIVAMVRAKAAETWGRVDSTEFRIISDLIERNGLPDSGFDPIPGYALASRASPLSTSASNGGFLDATALTGYIPQFLARSVLLRLGATPVQLTKGTTVTPRGATALTPTWLTNETTATTATAPTFGQLTFNRRNLLVCVTLSRQLLLQSDAEEIVRAELVRACAAEIDRVGIQGSGANGQPLGILNLPAITTTSGATLTYQTMVNQMAAIANANAIVLPDALGFLTTPNVANILKNRYFSTAQFPIWTGPIPQGTIDLMDAMATTNCPSGSMLHGDFSQLLIAEWSDGLQIDVDPYSQFQSAFVTVRVCIAVDFQVTSPASFQITTGVT